MMMSFISKRFIISRLMWSPAMGAATALPGTYAYAKRAGLLFRRSTDPVGDCLLLARKPDSGALIVVRDKADAFLAQRIKATGIKTHTHEEKNGN